MRRVAVWAGVVLCCGLPAWMVGCSGGGSRASAPGAGAPNEPVAGPSGPYLVQIAPGDVPSIRIGVATPAVPSPSEIFAFMIYRSAGQSYFSTTADTLIDIVQAERLPAYDDAPAPRLGRTFNGTRQFLGLSGTPETYTVTATYNDPALLVGTTYYYRVRRLTDPQFGPGANPPDAASLQAATLNISRADVLSQPSAPLGPVTYFQPPTPMEPANGATGIQTDRVTFRWNQAVGGNAQGANDYVVEVFASNDPSTGGNPLYRSPTLSPMSSAGPLTWELTGANLGPGARFYWRVGGRRRGEAYPRVDTLPSASRYLWSEVRQFQTGLTPPPVP